VKENQKGLYEDIKDYFEGMESGEIGDLPEDIWQGEKEKGHGRIERREIRTVSDLVGRYKDNSAISDVQARKGERDGANGPVLHLKRRFFRGQILEIHTRALVNRKPVALEAGQERLEKMSAFPAYIDKPIPL
jgi:hypothetical protein